MELVGTSGLEPETIAARCLLYQLSYVPITRLSAGAFEARHHEPESNRNTPCAPQSSHRTAVYSRFFRRILGKRTHPILPPPRAGRLSKGGEECSTAPTFIIVWFRPFVNMVKPN